MTKPEIAVVEQKLEEVLTKLKDAHDPEQKRALSKQMRTLMSNSTNLFSITLDSDGYSNLLAEQRTYK